MTAALLLVKPLLAGLDDRRALVIDLRLGLSGDVLTRREIGDQIGVTQERVRQIEMGAIAKMHATLASAMSLKNAQEAVHGAQVDLLKAAKRLARDRKRAEQREERAQAFRTVVAGPQDDAQDPAGAPNPAPPRTRTRAEMLQELAKGDRRVASYVWAFSLAPQGRPGALVDLSR